jgi:hypothetical protein
MHRIISTLFVLLIATLNQNKVFSCNVQACQNWWNNQGDPNLLLAKTLKPPCKISPKFPETLTYGWSVDSGCDAAKQPNTCDLHKGAWGCYRHALANTGPGAQACYDQAGNWISDPWQGAGTLDKETPLGGFIQALKHGIEDVIPFNNCCVNTQMEKVCCSLYYEKRPPGVCEGEDLAE